MNATSTCPNCNNVFRGAFCNGCGQKITHRITMKHMLHDAMHVFTHTDRGFFHMFLQLFYKPGVVAHEYILGGKRKRYFLPFQYLVIISALATFVAANSHFFEITTQSMYAETGVQSATDMQKDFMMQAIQFQSKYYNLIILVQLPLFALGTYWVFKKQQLYFAEHLTLQTFLIAQTAVFGMIMMIFISIFKIDTGSMITFMSIISLLYQMMAIYQFFGKQIRFVLLRALVSYLIGTLFFFLLVIIVTVIVLAVFIAKKGS